MARVCCRVLVRRLAALLVLLAASALAQEPSGTGLFERPVLALDPGMHTAMINRADVDRSGSYAVTGSDDRTVRVWKVADGALLRTIPLPVGPERGPLAARHRQHPAPALGHDRLPLGLGGIARCAEFAVHGEPLQELRKCSTNRRLPNPASAEPTESQE